MALLRNLLLSYVKWLMHPQTSAEDHWDLAGEVATRVISVLAVCVLVSVVWLLLAPVLYTLAVRAVVVAFGAALLWLGFYLLGFRWLPRRRGRR